MAARTIFTLDARDNMYLDVLKDYLKLDRSQIKLQINWTFEDCVSVLKKKGINYDDLKSALVPSERNEIAFIFDTEKIKSSWYGLPVMSALLPLLDKQSTHSVLVGDYIGDNNIAGKLHKSFFEHLKPVREIDYLHHTQFYIVYINNLSDNMVRNINEGLKSFIPYAGYFDLTYSSFIKTYISTILIRLFIKAKTKIIQGHPDDLSNDENRNESGYPFNKNGFTCKSIQSTYYGLFLSYKIEREVFDGFRSDTTFAINAITENVFDITDFKLLVEERKFIHLKSLSGHPVSLEIAGISSLTLEEVEKFIKEKINSNYIYNLEFLQEHGTIKFNILIETIRTDNNKKFKLTVGLEYQPEEKTLRLLTMF